MSINKIHHFAMFLIAVAALFFVLNIIYVHIDVPLAVNHTMIDFPVQYYITQRNAENYGVIPVYGRYKGSPTAIEARFNGSDWQTIDSSPSGGKFSGNLAANVGQGRLDVRLHNDRYFSSVPNVSVGDIFAISGQSNAEGSGYDPQVLNSSNKYISTVYRQDNKWTIANDPTDTRTNRGSFVPLFANKVIQNKSIPVGFVTVSASSKPISAWLKGENNYNQLLNKVKGATYNTGNIKAIIFFQGESDTLLKKGVEGNYSLYKYSLTQFSENITIQTKASTVFVVQIGEIREINWSVSRTRIDNIRKAQNDSWGTHNISFGGVTYDIGPHSDGLHFRTNAELETLSERIWGAVKYQLYGGSDPVTHIVNITSSRNNITLQFNKNIFLHAGSKAEGFYMQNATRNWTDVNITGSTIEEKNLTLVLDTIMENASLSLGSFNDGAGKNVIVDENHYPVSPIFEYEIRISDVN